MSENLRYLDINDGIFIKNNCCVYHDCSIYCKNCQAEVSNFSAPELYSQKYNLLKFCHYCGAILEKPIIFGDNNSNLKRVTIHTRDNSREYFLSLLPLRLEYYPRKITHQCFNGELQNIFPVNHGKEYVYQGCLIKPITYECECCFGELIVHKIEKA